MVAKPVEPPEDAIRAACAAGDFEGATTAALKEYGPELFGYLVSMLRDHDTASEAFSLFSEKLWQSMRRFDWQCSLRTWCYRLAHNAGIDVLRGRGNKRHVGLSAASAISKLAAHVRTSTMSALRTAKRTALERLRDELPEEDRAILILRVDRGLEWRELAMVLAEGTGSSERLQDDAALKREAARLRKRFQLVVDRLKATARERKLL